MGLPGSGKTTLAKKLTEHLTQKYSVLWLNADEIRSKHNDWDFSEVGRIRQAKRMSQLASESKCDFVVCDFVAPLQQMRDIFNADFLIWMNTIKSSRFDDTNNVFVKPHSVDVEVDTQNADFWVEKIIKSLNFYKY